MIARFHAARDLFRSSLDQYLTACLAVDGSYVTGFLSRDGLSELTDCINDELAQLPSYEETILKAKAALSSARNHSTHIAPVGRLPTDVLVQIFQFVTADDGCSAHDQKGTNEYVFPRHPSILTQICSRWRQVALSCTYLWSHIDIPSPVSRDDATLARMKEYIARSGVSPLDIHIVEVEKPQVLAPIGLNSLARVLAPLSPRIRSLDLDLSFAPTLPFGPLATSGAVGYSMMFSTCFSNCTAGALERLSIRSSSPNTLCTFIAAAFSDSHKKVNFFGPSSETVVSVSTPEKVLEKLWLPVTVLRLRGFYPRWESGAYRGLVELRVEAAGDWSLAITEAEYRSILSSSPQLRILDFGTRITDTSLPDDDISPVRLEYLETLMTGERNSDQLNHFLRLIAPGSRPLSISLHQPPGRHLEPLGLEVQKFFARCNVEIIGVAGEYSYLQLVDLLNLVPDARALVLSQIHLEHIDWDESKFSSAESCLRDLYMLKDTLISRNDLFCFIGAHRIQRLVVAEDCEIMGTSSRTGVFDYQALREQVSPLGVGFVFVPSGESHPLRDWGWGL